jgi:hypothetical protein
MKTVVPNSSVKIQMLNINKDLQAFIIANEEEDERKMVLKHTLILGVPSSIVANQISGRRKAKTKLPTFYQTPDILYPPSIHLEQSSSERTAQYKAMIISGVLARLGMNVSTKLKRVVDLTGGLGVDSFFIGQACDQLDYVESNNGLSEIARHNHEVLGATRIRHHAMTAEAFMKSSGQRFDFVFIDPSRRAGTKKVFRLAECQPDIVRLLPSIFESADRVLIKASPLLDLHQGLNELKTVDKIFVVAVDHECREVLFLCSKEGVPEPPVTGVNLSSHFSGSDAGMEEFTFTFAEEKTARSVFSDPLTYLYEPHSWILKAGAFKTIGHRYGLSKLQVNTHLYTSDQLVNSFPGRIFRIENRKPDTARLKADLPEGKANVFVRNYPLLPEQLKKKLKIQDGGEKYLIGFSGAKEKFLVVATRVK